MKERVWDEVAFLVDRQISALARLRGVLRDDPYLVRGVCPHSLLESLFWQSDELDRWQKGADLHGWMEELVYVDGEWVGGFGRTRLSLLSAIERGDQLIEVRCLTRVMVWDQDGRPGLASARRVFGFREAVKRYFACRSGVGPRQSDDDTSPSLAPSD